MNCALESSRSEIESLRQARDDLSRQIQSSNVDRQALDLRCKAMESEMEREKNKSRAPSHPAPAGAPKSTPTPSSDGERVTAMHTLSTKYILKFV